MLTPLLHLYIYTEERFLKFRSQPNYQAVFEIKMASLTFLNLKQSVLFYLFFIVDTITNVPHFPPSTQPHPPLAFPTLFSVSMGCAYTHTCSFNYSVFSYTKICLNIC